MPKDFFLEKINKEWTNPEGTRRVEIMRSGCNVKPLRFRETDIHLREIGDFGNGVIMRVQEIIYPDGNVEYNMYLEVMIDRVEGKSPMMSLRLFIVQKKLGLDSSSIRTLSNIVVLRKGQKVRNSR